jgi:CRP-like cAMP-binding protein
MGSANSIFDELNAAELAHIRSCATHRQFAAGDIIFTEGDPVDYIYFIEEGNVSIFILRFTTEEQVCVLGPGDHFGEMAVFYKDRRTASARAASDTRLLTLDKAVFLELVRKNRGTAEKINALLAQRNEELVLKESLMDSTGLDGRKFHVSIKGDPSIRESAFSRERYESIVDPILPELVEQMEELLLRRAVFQLFVHFNSGEVHTLSVFDPFREEIHPATRIADAGYVERHYPAMAYEEKSDLIRRLYGFLEGDEEFGALPELARRRYSRIYRDWFPTPAEEIRNALARLPELRTIPNFFLRNFALSVTREAIRMQFNCDGTHIVGAEDYNRFLDENLF